MTRSVSVGGMTLGNVPVVDGAGVAWTLENLDGFDDSGSGVRADDSERAPGNDGSFPTPADRTGRSIAVDGFAVCPTRAAAGAVTLQLRALLAGGSFGTLTVVDADLPTMSVTARIAAKPTVDWSDPLTVQFGLEFWAPDGLAYGDPIAQTATFPTAGGGLRTPLFTDGAVGVGRLDFGAPGSSGRLLLSNPGSADASPQYTVNGPVPPEGFDIVCVDTGERLTFESGISAGSLVVLDSATGRVLLNGDSDRSGYLTTAQWFKIPAGGSLTVAFLSRGATTAATMTATVRPPWW